MAPLDTSQVSQVSQGYIRGEVLRLLAFPNEFRLLLTSERLSGLRDYLIKLKK